MGDVFERVIKATVKLTKLRGCGSVIPGGFILTAAHCVEWSAEGGMVLGDYHVEPVEIGEFSFRASPAAVEPCRDIAILNSLDDQVFFDDAQAFEEMVESVEAIPVCADDYELFQTFPIRIWAHTGRWLKGTAQKCHPAAASLHVETNEPIECGTSGSPIVNDRGEVVAVVSNSSEFGGLQPQPHLALPVWAVRQTSGI